MTRDTTEQPTARSGTGTTTAKATGTSKVPPVPRPGQKSGSDVSTPADGIPSVKPAAKPTAKSTAASGAPPTISPTSTPDSAKGSDIMMASGCRKEPNCEASTR